MVARQLATWMVTGQLVMFFRVMTNEKFVFQSSFPERQTSAGTDVFVVVASLFVVVSFHMAFLGLPLPS
jgi:hypothetical protein